MLCFAAGSLCAMTAFMPAEKKQIAGNSGIGDTTAYRDLYEDTWVATDALGRHMPSFEEVGAVKKDQRRVTGVFYITWHTGTKQTGWSYPFRAILWD